ncbi:MAG TPA: glycosyltransferase family 2 protein [Puia sp.]|nr:glycosyltransferase family 2 protein [Puia sp.]
MTALKIIFWLCLFLVAYSYAGYSMLIFLLIKLRNLTRRRVERVDKGKTFQPPVSLVVSAYNEQEFIETKIQNTLELSYPRDLLKIIFITDGSSDQTTEIVRRYPEILLLHEPQRRGKLAAMNRAMEFVSTPYVIFSDANTLLNAQAVAEIVLHYADPLVGGVAGEKKVLKQATDTAAGIGEGLYWRYESFLKKLDSTFYSVVGAAGELFSVRTDLFEKEEKDVIIEDFVQSLKICMKGYVIRYEPNAYAIETSSASMKDEQKRKIRICAGAFQAMGMLRSLFNVFKYPVLSFQFISHRILRWTLCPVALLFLVIINIMIIILSPSPLFILLMVLQAAFYLSAVIGWLFANRNIKLKILYIPYYFLFMNVAVFLGFKRFMMKQQSVLWEKAARQALAQ